MQKKHIYIIFVTVHIFKKDLNGTEFIIFHDLQNHIIGLWWSFLFNFTIFPHDFVSFLFQISYILVYFMFVLTYGYLDIRVYTPQKYKVSFSMSTFVIYTNGILLKFYLISYFLSFNFMLLSFMQCIHLLEHRHSLYGLHFIFLPTL